MFDYIFFDLDGTIIDSKEGVLNSMEYALQKFGLSLPEPNEALRFVGPPLFDTFTSCYNMDSESANLAIKYYREHFTKIGIYENVLYHGIFQMLESQSKSGSKLVIATTKPEIFAQKIVKYHKIDKFFTYVAGADLEGTRSLKSDVLAYAIKSCSMPKSAKAVMVGDSHLDVAGARKCSLPCIAVLYGYGDIEKIENEHPIAFARSPFSLSAYLSEL